MTRNNHEIVVTPTSSMPKGYILVRKGNVYLTSNCRTKTHEARQKLYVVQNLKKKTLGIRCPRSIFISVLALHEETKATRHAAVAAKDARLNQKAEEQILDSFPSIQRDLIPDILNHTLKKRSGRVGRTATIPFELSIELAVRAFVRHKMTDYDALLRDGMDQKSAREKIRGKVEKIVEEWKSKVREEVPQMKNIRHATAETNTVNPVELVIATRKKRKDVIEVVDLTKD